MYDYNLLTGKIIYEAELRICKDGAVVKTLPQKRKIFTHTKQKLESMQDYIIGENTVDLDRNLSFQY
jgi:hypothetical protein